MYKEWNILTLENMMNDETLTSLRRYFVWELIKEIKEAQNG